MQVRKAFSVVVLLMVAGCQYYKVTDPTTGKEYITDNWHSGRTFAGAVEFRDLKSGDMVTLSNSELHQIPGDEAKAEMAK